MATSDPIISPLADPVTFSDVLITSEAPSENYLVDGVDIFTDGTEKLED